MFLSSCTSLTSSIKSPTNYIEFNKNDFEYTKQVSSKASIDFFLTWPLNNTRKTGEFSKSSAIIYGFPSKLKKAENVAIYNLLKENPGYDVVLYPKFDTKFSGFIITNAEVTVTARLGKLKK
jgi:hypothetical protein